jgi:hypothetical protein
MLITLENMRSLLADVEGCELVKAAHADARREEARGA